MVDIAARKLAEAALRDSEDRLNGIVYSAMDAIISVDSLQRIVLFNRAAQTMFGYAPADVLGQPLDRLMPSRFAAGHALKVTNFGKEATTARKVGALGVLLGLRADGEEFPIEVSISRSQIGGDALFTAIIRDVSESKVAQQQLQRSRDDLRALANRLQTGREEQRAHLAREIHDVLAQELTRLKIDLSWMKRRLGGPVDEPLRENLLVRAGQAMALIDSSITTVQRIATELRPVVLDSLGLFAAIEWQVEDFGQRSGLKCSTSVVQDDVPPNRDISIVLFRILQESLTNIARHAHATEVQVKLEMQHDTWVITVHDNGVGITEEQIAAHRSLGLLGMGERALAIGGSVHFAGSPSEGTTITARVPAGA